MELAPSPKRPRPARNHHEHRTRRSHAHGRGGSGGQGGVSAVFADARRSEGLHREPIPGSVSPALFHGECKLRTQMYIRTYTLQIVRTRVTMSRGGLQEIEIHPFAASGAGRPAGRSTEPSIVSRPPRSCEGQITRFNGNPSVPRFGRRFLQFQEAGCEQRAGCPLHLRECSHPAAA